MNEKKRNIMEQFGNSEKPGASASPVQTIVSHLLLPALRQYSHNNRSGDLLAGYDKEDTEKIVLALVKKTYWMDATTQNPKLYTKVLVKLINGAGKNRKSLAEYIPADTVLAEDFMHDYWIDDHPEEEYAPAGWYEVTEEHEIQYPLTGNVTHWMYLEG